MNKEKSSSFDTKQYNRGLYCQRNRDSSTIVSCSVPTRLDGFEFSEEFGFSDPSHDSSDQDQDQEEDSGSEMTRDVQQDCSRVKSKPITIPRAQITKSSPMEEDIFPSRISPANSVGDSVYNSPKLPSPSKDFDRVMMNHQKEVKRVKSYDEIGLEDSDADSRESPFPLSCSLPADLVSPPIKGKRRTVHFDEATITTTADLGESAARFRMICRRKRGIMVVPCPRFGESKNITVQHKESDDVPSPQFERKEKNKSIFDVCSYSSYGKYT